MVEAVWNGVRNEWKIGNVNNAFRAQQFRGREGGCSREKWSQSVLFAVRQ